MSGLMSVKE
ncbi:Protein of unknown function [Propionibacterium freudenreichii subsp. freudenreichii]|uniref:Uncharacterized protein n=1 Tax=Propionibacterium freudenreichii subsp. freudenreichii TaxID=66712 RepID=A0A0B7P088_PROFF|nr:Protein of unknown function [Propionibacterium freudenreichii subsp. freudenreichii]